MSSSIAWSVCCFSAIIYFIRLFSGVSGSVSDFIGLLGNIGGGVSDFVGLLGNISGGVSDFIGLLGNIGGGVSDFVRLFSGVSGSVSYFIRLLGNISGSVSDFVGLLGNIGSGLLAGLNMVRLLRQEPLITLPPTTMLGALAHYVTHAEAKDFQPMKANFGILPPTQPHIRNKGQRYEAYVTRTMTALEAIISEQNVLIGEVG